MKKSLFLFLLALPIMTSAQNLEWAKSMGGLGSDFGNAIAVDAAGNVYTTGQFSHTVDFDPGAGISNLVADSDFYDAYVQKLDPQGELVWVKRIGGKHNDGGFSIQVDAAGNVYTTGYFRDTVDFDPNTGIYTLIAQGSLDVFIQKLDAGGNFLWAKALGGTDYDFGHSVAVDDLGNVYLTGVFSGTADFDPSAGVYNQTAIGESDIFIQRLDAGGNLVWIKTMGGTDIDHGKSISVDATGNVYTLGTFKDTVDFDPNTGIHSITAIGESDIFLQKLAPNGDLIWVKTIGGNIGDYGLSISVDGLGNIYTTGGFEGTVDFDPNTGIYPLVAAGSIDIFIQKLDAAGNLLWVKNMGGTEQDLGLSLVIDHSGNVFTTGYFQETVDFDPNPGTKLLTAMGVKDIFLQKLDTNGNLIWVTSVGATGADGGYALATDPSGNLYSTGFFTDTVDFDPGLGISNLNTAGFADIFIQKISTNTVGIPNIPVQTLTLYPNPSTGLFTIDLPKHTQAAHLEISDRLGRRVYQQTVTPADNQIDLSHLSKGLYQVMLSLNTGERFSGKLVLVP